MTCDEARDLMMAADLAALAGRGASDLAVHLAACPACAARAALLLRGQAMLDDALTALGPRASRDGEARALARWRRRRTRHARLRHWGLPAAALTLAATITVMVLTGVPRSPDRPRPGPSATAGAPDGDVPERVRLDVPADRSTLVLATADPEITIVWYP